MLKMPTKTGYMVEWETGEMWGKNKNHPVKNDVYTTSYDKACKLKKEKEDAGFKNVQMYECIF